MAKSVTLKFLWRLPVGAPVLSLSLSRILSGCVFANMNMGSTSSSTLPLSKLEFPSLNPRRIRKKLTTSTPFGFGLSNLSRNTTTGLSLSTGHYYTIRCCLDNSSNIGVIEDPAKDSSPPQVQVKTRLRITLPFSY